MKPNYIIIPLITVFVSLLGGWLTSSGMSWYKSINLPSWTPPGSIIGLVWTILFILATISALIVWNSLAGKNNFSLIIAIFILNSILNFGWSWLFFNQHLIGLAFFEAILLGFSVVALIILIWPMNRLAASLLILYAAWVAFASYLTYMVWRLNS